MYIKQSITLVLFNYDKTDLICMLPGTFHFINLFVFVLFQCRNKVVGSKVVFVCVFFPNSFSAARYFGTN